MSMGDSGAAERFLRRAVELGCASAEAELNLGVLLSRKALWRAAVPHFRRSIELEGEHPTAYLCLGEALNCTDDLSGALSAFEKAQDLDPNNQRALRGLGVVYDRLGRSEEAVEMYHRSRRSGYRFDEGR
jgi:Flp pilus assembly protein TadD